jgi:cytochrome c oxidase subunit 2
MDREERIWLGVLVVVFLLVNAITLSPLVPWHRWLLWARPTAQEQVRVEFANYEIRLPPQGIQVKAGQFVEFIAVSKDVTYGFGVFRKDGKLVFQMQVVPGYENRIVWRFDEPGTYDVRSTEYSGPRHPEMLIPDAIQVVP